MGKDSTQLHIFKNWEGGENICDEQLNSHECTDNPEESIGVQASSTFSKTA